MVGLIHRLLINMLEEMCGARACAEVLQQVGFEPEQQFRIDTDYDDQQFQQLLGAVLTTSQLTEAQFEQQFAGFFLDYALQRWPRWFEMSANAKSFLERQPRIHNGFASSMLTEAERSRINDKFSLESNPNDIVLHYRSPNRLCGLYKSLAVKVLQHYGETAELHEHRCMKQGDTECCITITWPEQV